MKEKKTKACVGRPNSVVICGVSVSDFRTERRGPMPQNKRLVTTRRIAREELCEDAIALCDVRVFLEGYAMAVRMLRLCRVDEKTRRDLPGDATYYGCVGGDATYWKEKMKDIRDFIESLPNESCKLLLYYHYVVGMTVERASEELDISRRNAFRLKKKALGLAAARFPLWRAAERQSC